jgi:hypothetical protein
VERGKLAGKASDPFLSDLELPFVRTFYPLGFAVNLATNSADVLECARESWSGWARQFDTDPVEIRMVVQEEGELAPEPQYRSRDHLFTIVSDPQNFAVLDLDRLYSTAFVSRQTAADHAWLRWYFLDALAFFQICQRYVVALHAACVARNGRGILLAGESCAGKSTLAWACARAGWTYVTDDAAWMKIGGDRREVMGRSHLVRFRPDAPRFFPELAGFVSRVRPNGKVAIEAPTSEFPNIHTAPRCQVHAVVFLDRSGAGPAGLERVESGQAMHELLGERAEYREEVRARYRATVRRLTEAPAYRMRYKDLEEGIAILGDLHASLGR